MKHFFLLLLFSTNICYANIRNLQNKLFLSDTITCNCFRWSVMGTRIFEFKEKIIIDTVRLNKKLYYKMYRHKYLGSLKFQKEKQSLIKYVLNENEPNIKEKLVWIQADSFSFRLFEVNKKNYMLIMVYGMIVCVE